LLKVALNTIKSTKTLYFFLQKIMEDPKAKKRVLKSYMMMLDFYGMIIKDEVTGEIEKAENWKERFQHLNRLGLFICIVMYFNCIKIPVTAFNEMLLSLNKNAHF